MWRKHKKKIWPVFYLTLLGIFSVYVLLDTFVIARSMAVVPQAETENAAAAAEDSGDGSFEVAAADTSANTDDSDSADDSVYAGDSDSVNDSGANNSLEPAGNSVSDDSSPSVTDSSYSDENISISLTEYREYDTTIYVADVTLASADYLKTAFADSTYGRNVTEKTSEIADSVDAILAINGDYYGAQEKGYVIRGGVLYRDSAVAGQEDLVIYADGSFSVINESDVTAQELLDAGAVNVLSFGPGLIENGEIAVSAGEEVGKAMASNPRTAIAITEDGHYLFVVSDGRTSESSGLSLSEMAAFLQSLGVKTAYNLDGGGSSTMVFNGEIINNPTTGGRHSKERSVSDIVYIGY